MTLFDHERLDVYQAALQFAGKALPLADNLSQGRSSLADQLRRAAASISLNIAEGSGEFTAKEKARFYRMAKRSATECAAVLDVAGQWVARGDEDFDRRMVESKELLRRIVAMLIRMIQAVERAN